MTPRVPGAEGGGRRSRDPVIVPADEAVIERVAYIMGEGSASARALAELKRRRAAGEDVMLFSAPGWTLVGPTPLAGSAARAGTTEGE